VVMKHRDVGVEVEKRRLVVLIKRTLCLSTQPAADNLCDHIYPHMGKGLVV
jgi:hypothetical protein